MCKGSLQCEPAWSAEGVWASQLYIVPVFFVCFKIKKVRSNYRGRGKSGLALVWLCEWPIREEAQLIHFEFTSSFSQGNVKLRRIDGQVEFGCFYWRNLSLYLINFWS
ncbi:hypothetical protein ACRRTK_024169 [Alexandromys fortis]